MSSERTAFPRYRVLGITFHASPEKRRFAFAYSTSPRATGATSSSSSAGSIWLSAAITHVTSIPSSSARA